MKAAALSALVAALICYPVSGHALNAAQKPNADELKKLPSFCQVRVKYFGTGKDGPDQRKWKELLGPDYQHLHHYCFGLNWLTNRANSYGLTIGERKFCLRRAVDEFSYTIKFSSRKFKLLPEAFLLRATAYYGLGKFDLAVNDLVEALAIKPDYVKAYALLADSLMALGDAREAQKVLKLGVSKTNGSKLLLQKLKDLQDSTKTK